MSPKQRREIIDRMREEITDDEYRVLHGASEAAVLVSLAKTIVIWQIVNDTVYDSCPSDTVLYAISLVLHNESLDSEDGKTCPN